MGAGVPTARAAGTPGDQRRWTLDFRVRLEPPAGERPVEIALSGDWVSTVIAVRPGEYDAAIQLVDARLNRAQALARLNRRFWATYGSDGALRAIHFFKDVDPADRNLLQTIATTMQLVCSTPDRPVWTAMERDGAGNYLAIYQRPDWNSVVKRKLKYLYADGAAGAPVDGMDVVVNQSELRFSLDPDGGIAALEGSDRLRTGLPLADAGQLTASTEIHLAGLRRGRAPELIGSLARASSNVESSPVVTHMLDPEQDLARRDAHLLEGRTTKSLLEAAIAEQDDSLLQDRLAALFRRRPEAAAGAMELLRKEVVQQRITRALASAGSPQAVTVLGSVARDRSAPSPVRIDTLSALVLVQHPSVEAMRVPATMFDDADVRVAIAARLAGGALARAGRGEHREEADAIDAALIARYRKAREVGELCDLLGALGNSVGSATLAVIAEARSDSRAEVRGAAARALRNAEGTDADRLLAETMTADSDASVRAAAIFAAGFRHPLDPTLAESLRRAAKEDSVEHVRNSAIALLSQNRGATPGIAETLAWIAEHDDKPTPRRLAREALESPSAKRR
jgi:hypothetical protein